MSENLFNYNTSLPFDVIGTDMTTGGRNRVVNKKTQNPIKVPESFKNIEDAKRFYGEGNLPSFLQGVEPQLPEGTEVLPSGKIVDKNRPTGGGRVLAGAQDFLNLLLGKDSDLDRLGGLYKKDEFDKYYYDTGTEYGNVADLTDKDAILSPYQQLQTQQDVESKTAEPKTALESTEEYLDLIKKSQDELLPGQRKRARAGAIDEFLNYTLTEPVRQSLLDRAGRLASQRYLDTRGIVEAMPSNVQKIMKSKQEQQALADAGFAAQAGAIAGQTDAATRMAGLGLQRRFG